MSVRVMGGVWDLDLPAPKKLVLLALADHADHDGMNVRPSVRLIARKTGYSERQVQYVMRQLEDDGYLIVQQPGGGRGHPTHYRIVIKGEQDAPITTTKGAIHSVNSATKGANHDTKRVQTSRARVDKIEPSNREPIPATPDTAKPWDVFEAVCDELGRDATAIPSDVRSKQLAVAKRLIADGFTPADGRLMVRWLAPQSWVSGAVDLFLIEKQRAKWEMAGRPSRPPSRSSPRNGKTTALDFIRMAEDMERAERDTKRDTPALSDRQGELGHLRSDGR